MTDSPRWCSICQNWGDHHADRCTSRKPLDRCPGCGCELDPRDRHGVRITPLHAHDCEVHRDLDLPEEWRDPGKPEHDGAWIEAAAMGVLALAAVALCVWLLTRHVDPCPDGWHERTTPTATVCTNPRSNPGR